MLLPKAQVAAHVSRARITQIMNLLLLAPDIQEEILHLPRTVVGRGLIRETDLRPIVQVAEWRKQRGMWRELRQDTQGQLARPIGRSQGPLHHHEHPPVQGSQVHDNSK